MRPLLIKPHPRTSNIWITAVWSDTDLENSLTYTSHNLFNCCGCSQSKWHQLCRIGGIYKYTTLHMFYMHSSNANKTVAIGKGVVQKKPVLPKTVLRFPGAFLRSASSEAKQERPQGQRKTPPPTNQIIFCDIQSKVVLSRRQIYVYHSHLLPLKIWVTLTLTFQGHSRSNLIVPLYSLYVVSY